MPTYSYRCENCGHEFERVQRITENALKDCPNCNEPKAKRQIQSGNFILKGGGWYSDLYSGGSNKSGTSSSSAPSSTSSSSTAAPATTPTSTPSSDSGSGSSGSSGSGSSSSGSSSSGSSGGGTSATAAK